MKVLVDHGSYELQNMGDVAMLVACVRRIQNAAPEAEVLVITTDAGRLADLLPGTVPVMLSRPSRVLPRRVRQRIRVRWKRAFKTASAITAQAVRRVENARDYSAPRLLSLSRAIADADIVVAAGGGYLNDLFPAHGRGVLSVIRTAQRRGRVTAMMGQGLGPIAHPAMRRQARETLVRLDILTLREGQSGPHLLGELGIADLDWSVVGDEAPSVLTLAGMVEVASPPPPRLGLNLRVAKYAGTPDSQQEEVQAAIQEFSERVGGLSLVALPILLSGPEADLASIAKCAPPCLPIQLANVDGPSELGSRASTCRAVLTGAYHAAVFALAVGVPVVAISNSEYYDWKFGGLRDLYGSHMVSVVSASGIGATDEVMSALMAAWDLPDEARSAARGVTAEFMDRQDGAYRTLLELGNG